jgi:hypothetical protein
MSQYFHSAWQDGVTRYTASDMNAPLGQLDQWIYNVSGEVFNRSGEMSTGVHDFHDACVEETGQPVYDDEVVIYDTSAGSYKRVARNNFADTGQTYGIGIYDMGISIPGTPTASQVICTYPMPRSVTFPAGMGSSRAAAGTAATGSTVFSLKKDDVEFATCTFAASATTGTFSGDLSAFAAGEVFTLVAPASPDATLADIGFALTAVRIT